MVEEHKEMLASIKAIAVIASVVVGIMLGIVGGTKGMDMLIEIDRSEYECITYIKNRHANVSLKPLIAKSMKNCRISKYEFNKIVKARDELRQAKMDKLWAAENAREQALIDSVKCVLNDKCIGVK